MSILGAVYYDKLTPAHSTSGWIRSERYEYCDGFYEEMTAQKSGFLKRITAMLLAVL